VADKLWKANERWWAKRLTDLTGKEARRLPINGRGKQPDVLHPDYPTECKERETIPAWITKALDQSEETIKNGEETPIVQIHLKNQNHEKDIVMMRLPTFERFVNPNKRR
jgi:hypothetical protein